MKRGPLLLIKVCRQCNRSFSNRKKWESRGIWDKIVYCSDKCRKESRTKISKMKAVWWIKRDFRITDNICLSNALEKCGEVVPFFCWENSIMEAGDFSGFHLQAQFQALNGLSDSISKRGGYMRIVSGMIIDQFERLFRVYPFKHLFSHQETGNLISYKRDIEVREWCQQYGVIWEESVQSTVLRGGDANRRRNKAIHSNFRQTAPLPPPNRVICPSNKDLIEQKFDLKELRNHFSSFLLSTYLQEVSEKSAWSTLHSFLNSRGVGYSGGISSPNTAFKHGSRLSVHLAWGTISLRSIFAEIGKKRSDLKNEESCSSWKKAYGLLNLGFIGEIILYKDLNLFRIWKRVH